MKYRYWFSNVRGISNTKKRMLREHFITCEGIYRASVSELMETGFLRQSQAKRITASRTKWDLEGEYESFLKKDMEFLNIDDPAFPPSLREIADAPFVLYYRGKLPDTNERLVAMVGARRASEYGKSISGRIAGALAEAGFSVVSGMALGIDAASHWGAIAAGGRTYAVLGCGVDRIYPKSNRKLYQRIIEQGAVLSEYPPGTEPRPLFFPVRNRIISGLSERVLVLEAKGRSGSLITADLALEQGRDVYALPGRITDPLSEGTNTLIHQGAGMITSVEGLIRDFQDFKDFTTIMPAPKNVPQLNLEKDELLVYSCFDFYAKGIDEVQAECGMDLIPLMQIVARLSMRGLIREIFKNRYIRLIE